MSSPPVIYKNHPSQAKDGSTKRLGLGLTPKSVEPTWGLLLRKSQPKGFCYAKANQKGFCYAKANQNVKLAGGLGLHPSRGLGGATWAAPKSRFGRGDLGCAQVKVWAGRSPARGVLGGAEPRPC